jgi:hypothetical protein
MAAVAVGVWLDVLFGWVSGILGVVIDIWNKLYQKTTAHQVTKAIIYARQDHALVFVEAAFLCSLRHVEVIGFIMFRS